MRKIILQWIKKEMVLVIAGIAALLSMLFVVPSIEYMQYIDYRVLALLFCLMAVVAGLQKNGVFLVLSKKVISGVKTTRSMCYILILLCFFSSMWITNDVALITFVPFSILILNLTGQNKYLSYVIVMQSVAANLGSMLTPVGNPQNLYLYSFYHVDSIEFLKITLPFVIVSFIIISIISMFIKSESITMDKENETKPFDEKIKLNKSHTVVYFSLFILCLGSVLHVVDYRITLIIVLSMIGIMDKSIFAKVDYYLLLTFVCFFIFVGNIGKIDSVCMLITETIKGRELLSSILLSQIISNVPAAVLLSNFTQDTKSLILGTNIGGLGTIIASLASLISFKFYCKTENSKPLKYLGIFTVTNVLILIILCFYQIVLDKSQLLI